MWTRAQNEEEEEDEEKKKSSNSNNNNNSYNHNNNINIQNIMEHKKKKKGENQEESVDNMTKPTTTIIPTSNVKMKRSQIKMNSQNDKYLACQTEDWNVGSTWILPSFIEAHKTVRVVSRQKTFTWIQHDGRSSRANRRKKTKEKEEEEKDRVSKLPTEVG